MDDEDYWNQSNAKGFSWDDAGDAVSLPTSSNSISSNTGLAGQETDLVSFSDSGRAASTRHADRVREAARQLARVAEVPEPSISQVVGVRDVNTLEAELKLVRRNFAKLQMDRFKPNSVSQTIQDMILGKPFTLDGFKSLKEKEHLLDTALEWGDGDVILAVTQMIRATLKRSKFISIISSRQEAADHLISDMIVRHQLTEVIDLLNSLDRSHEAGIIAYKQAATTQNLSVRSKNLKQVLNIGLRNHLDTDNIMEQIHLTERLSPVISTEVGHLDRHANNLVNASVLKSLQYLATHHFNATENLLTSPAAVRKMHNLSEKQFIWVCLRARATVGAWQDCLDLVVGKGWLGGKKVKGGVSPGEITRVLAAAGAPQDTLVILLGLVDNTEERQEVARKVGAASVVVDVFVTQKDRCGLVSYLGSLAPNSSDWFYAENALKNSSMKWKN